MKNLNENSKLYSVIITDNAQKFFDKASASLQKKLFRCFDQLKIDPYLHPNIKSLKGKFKGLFRYRVGNYRVIYEINDQEITVIVITISHRSKIYE